MLLAVVLAGLVAAVSIAMPAQSQEVFPDTLPVTLERTPGGALWRAAVAPGWGQIYNGQYYKLPFVYAGLGGLVASALYNNNRYLLYRHAYLYALDPVANARYAGDAAPFSTVIAAGQESLLRRERDAYRRNRDLSYIGIGLFYALTVLDAYVNAHLLDFDVDDDLSIRLMPGVDGRPAVLAAWRVK